MLGDCLSLTIEKKQVASFPTLRPVKRKSSDKSATKQGTAERAYTGELIMIRNLPSSPVE
jgi:hypothetical protein